eukprot:1157353-Pelagomonas_calceolata.AAC.4
MPPHDTNQLINQSALLASTKGSLAGVAEGLSSPALSLHTCHINPFTNQWTKRQHRLPAPQGALQARLQICCMQTGIQCLRSPAL